VRLPDRWLLLAPRDVLASTASRLRMFVLRAKVQIAPSDEWLAAALVGADDEWLAAHALPAGTPVGGVVTRGELHWVRIGDRRIADAIDEDAGAERADSVYGEPDQEEQPDL